MFFEPSINNERDKELNGKVLYRYDLKKQYASRPSFTHLTRERFKESIHKEIARRLRTYDIDLLSTEIESVCISGFKDDSLFFYAYCRCFINDNGREVCASFTVKCMTLCSEGYRRVSITDVCSGKRACIPDIPLGDDLVPLIGKNNVDAMSKRLIDYIKNGLRIFADQSDGYALAQALGLKVVFIPFDASGNILGKLLFEGTDMDIILNGSKQKTHFDAKTIILNKRKPTCGLNGCDNNTLLHECVHWLLHRYAYRLEKEFNGKQEIAAFRSVASSAWQSADPIDRMEWQANAVSPRILLPEAKTRTLVDIYSGNSHDSTRKCDINSSVAGIVSNYSISQSLTRIRLSELGYYSISDDMFANKQHVYSITPKQVLKEYERNDKLRGLLENGQYVYIDGRFCELHGRNIQKNQNGELQISDYAATHQDKCCLWFDKKTRYVVSADGMCRGKDEEVSFGGSPQSIADFTKQTIMLTEILQTLPSTYSGTLRAHIRRSGLTIEKLAEICEISEKTIQRYKSSDENECELSILVALCVGLKLHPILSFDLLSKAGYGSLRSSKKHTAYKLVLLTMYECTVSQCNEFLREAGGC